MKRHILHDLFRNILMVVIVLLLTIPAAGAAPNRGLAVPNETLPAELKGVPVQDSYTGSGANAVGEIQSVVGHVVVFREDKQYAYFAAPKDKLFERDVIFTLNASRCRFQLFSSDTATMSDNTRILIKSYMNNRSTGVKSTSFVMKKGKAMFYALRLFMYKGSSMEVETPTAVSGVRGTKWGVEVIEGKESASLPILVADASDLGAFRQLAQASTGGGGFTIIHSFEGAVFVTGTTGQTITLNSGQSLQSGVGGLGNPYPTPPGTSQQFQSDTSAPGGSGSDSTGGTGDGSTGSQTLAPDNSSLVQGQGQSLQTRPVSKFGYYVGMLTQTSGSGGYAQTWMTDTLQNLGSSAKAIIVGGPDNYLLIDDFTNMTYLKYSTPVTAGLPQPIQQTELGYNSYLTWGYWTQPTTMTNAGGTYIFNNKGYYVMGDVTNAMPTSISGTYSGIANGTVYDTGGGTPYYNGTFSMNVTYASGTGSVSAFNVSIGTPGAGVSITGGAGNITGNSFSVSNATATINGTGGQGRAYGSFYGPTGQMVGGIWSAATGTPTYANGNFVGSKP